MKYIVVILAPNKTCGFGNQIYMMANAITYAIENKINFVFFTEYLNEINTDSYSDVSNIIDIEKTNKFLLKYNVQIADYNNFELNIQKIMYGGINITDYFNINNKLEIKKDFSFSDITRKQEGCNNCFITYSLNNISYNMKYDLYNEKLQEDLIIDLNNVIPYKFTIYNNCPIYYDVRTNILFNRRFMDDLSVFIQQIKQDKLNCIHLRVEDDCVYSLSRQHKITFNEMKDKLEKKYIKEIAENIDKNDMTLILSSNYNNNVIKFLEENNYKYLTTPKLSPFRDISAIYDFHIAGNCNNIYIGLYESTFSYLVLYKICNKITRYIEIKSN